MPNSASSLRVGAIGCGRILEAGYLPALRGLPEVELVALAEPDPGRRAELAARRSQAAGAVPWRVFPGAEEMLGTGGLDAVLIASPAAEHVAHAELAARAGLPCLVEKPPAPDLAGAVRLAELGDRVWLGFNRRFMHGRVLAALSPAARARREPVELELEIRYRRRAWGAYAVRDEALLDLGPHLIDLALGALGAAAEEVRVRSASRRHERAELVLEAAGSRARLRCETDRPYCELVDLRHRRGGRLGRSRRGGPARNAITRLPRVEHPLIGSLRSQLLAFARAARGEDGGLLADAGAGIRAMAVLEQARAVAR